MKKYFCILLISFSFEGFTQENSISGPIPFQGSSINKNEAVNYIRGTLTSNIAYGYSISSFMIMSTQILPGLPLTYSYLLPPYFDFAYSMCIGGNGKFYITTSNNEIYQFYPVTKQTGWQHINVSGLQPGEIISGITYNYTNDKYYLAAGSFNSDNIYNVNITTGMATLVGPTGTGGRQADLTIDCEGNCYSYDLLTNNAYKIDLTTGLASLLGPLGFNPAYAQGMAFDRENGIVYLSAFDSTTWHAQLRSLNTNTGETTLIADWGLYEEIAPFVISTKCYNDCSLEASGNPGAANPSWASPKPSTPSAD